MMGRWFKKALLYGAEAFVAVILVLVFFFACITILGLSFPKGAGLRDLMGGSSWTGDSSSATRLSFDRSGGSQSGTPRIIAHLVDVRDRVKDKQSNRVDWGVSRAGSPLEERHAVQTFSLSTAVIGFEGHGEVTLGENSLLVVGAAPSEEAARRGDVSLLVSSGGLRGTLGGQRGSSGEFQVLTPGGSARIGAGTPSTELQVSVNPDRSSTFAVYSGTTEITAAGHTVTLRPNQAVTVMPGTAPGEPVALPVAPVLADPAAHAQVPCRNVPPLLAFSWQPVPGASGYRVQIARDSGFKSLVDDDRVFSTGFAQGNLEPGNYFWRVSAMRGSAEGKASVSRSLAVVEDIAPPFLQVSFPEERVEQSTIVIRGETEPGADVFVGTARVPTDAAGRFSHEVELTPGWNLVVVEAIDSAGNVAHQSQRLMTGGSPEARFQ